MRLRDAVSCLFVTALIGCGGGGGGGGGGQSGRAVMTVAWPARSRLIPVASESIKAEVVRNGSVVASGVLARPNTSITFENLPVGALIVNASAHPVANGTGVAQASGAVIINVLAGETTQFTVTMNSTIDRVEVGPANVKLDKGQTQQLTATPRNSANQVVLVGPSTLQWSSSAPEVSVNSTGVAKGENPGSARITAAETESGKSGFVDVSVNLIVTVSPDSPVMSVRDSQTFTAAVQGTANQAVTWSIQEGAAGGSITAGGVYTAPALPGTYHVIATSQADPTRKATVDVVVQAGNAAGTIQ